MSIKRNGEGGVVTYYALRFISRKYRTKHLQIKDAAYDQASPYH